MKKREIVKENYEFESIIKNGDCYKNKYYYIYYKDNKSESVRFGIAVSKKIGNAVVRNKIKRQLRMIIDNNKKLFKNGYNYIIIVRSNIKKISFQEMNDSMQMLLKKG